MTMTQYFRNFILASTLLFGMVWLIAGCGGSDTEPTGPGGGNEAPVSTHLIGSEDRQRMSDAAMSYVMMLQTMEPAAARAALVADLEETEGVAAATLFEDGYSIFVRLESGLDVALNTLDLAAVNEGRRPPRPDRPTRSRRGCSRTHRTREASAPIPTRQRRARC